MKAGADFEQASHAAVDRHPSFTRLGDARKNFQKRRLAGSIAAANAEDFAAFDLEAHILERPKLLSCVASDDGFLFAELRSIAGGPGTQRAVEGVAIPVEDLDAR
jgi:hypothetical protein